MTDFLLVWLGPAVALFVLELWTDIRARRNPIVAAMSALLWPIYIPLGVWVACNPKTAERIRRRFGSRRNT